jgi:hypothetical protein
MVQSMEFFDLVTSGVGDSTCAMVSSFGVSGVKDDGPLGVKATGFANSPEAKA